MAVSMLPTEEEHQSALEGTSNSLLYIDNKIASRTSMLYNVLPMVVQSRIPSLPSLRRSVSQFRTHGAQHRKSSSSSSEDEMQRPVTPPPEYRSREGSGSNTPIRQPSLAMTSVEIDISAEDVDLAAEEMMEDYRRTFPSSYEATSGVKWTFARQGTLLGVGRIGPVQLMNCRFEHGQLSTSICQRPTQERHRYWQYTGPNALHRRPKISS